MDSRNEATIRLRLNGIANVEKESIFIMRSTKGAMISRRAVTCAFNFALNCVIFIFKKNRTFYKNGVYTMTIMDTTFSLWNPVNGALILYDAYAISRRLAKEYKMIYDDSKAYSDEKVKFNRLREIIWKGFWAALKMTSLIPIWTIQTFTSPSNVFHRYVEYGYDMSDYAQSKMFEGLYESGMINKQNSLIGQIKEFVRKNHIDKDRFAFKDKMNFIAKYARPTSDDLYIENWKEFFFNGKVNRGPYDSSYTNENGVLVDVYSIAPEQKDAFTTLGEYAFGSTPTNLGSGYVLISTKNGEILNLKPVEADLTETWGMTNSESALLKNGSLSWKLWNTYDIGYYSGNKIECFRIENTTSVSQNINDVLDFQSIMEEEEVKRMIIMSKIGSDYEYVKDQVSKGFRNTTVYAKIAQYESVIATEWDALGAFGEAGEQTIYSLQRLAATGSESKIILGIAMITSALYAWKFLRSKFSKLGDVNATSGDGELDTSNMEKVKAESCSYQVLRKIIMGSTGDDIRKLFGVTKEDMVKKIIAKNSIIPEKYRKSTEKRFLQLTELITDDMEDADIRRLFVLLFIIYSIATMELDKETPMSGKKTNRYISPGEAKRERMRQAELQYYMKYMDPGNPKDLLGQLLLKNNDKRLDFLVFVMLFVVLQRIVYVEIPDRNQFHDDMYKRSNYPDLINIVTMTSSVIEMNIIQRYVSKYLLDISSNQLMGFIYAGSMVSIARAWFEFAMEKSGSIFYLLVPVLSWFLWKPLTKVSQGLYKMTTKGGKTMESISGTLRDNTKNEIIKQIAEDIMPEILTMLLVGTIVSQPLGKVKNNGETDYYNLSLASLQIQEISKPDFLLSSAIMTGLKSMGRMLSDNDYLKKKMIISDTIYPREISFHGRFKKIVNSTSGEDNQMQHSIAAFQYQYLNFKDVVMGGAYPNIKKYHEHDSNEERDLVFMPMLIESVLSIRHYRILLSDLYYGTDSIDFDMTRKEFNRCQLEFRVNTEIREKLMKSESGSVCVMYGKKPESLAGMYMRQLKIGVGMVFATHGIRVFPVYRDKKTMNRIGIETRIFSHTGKEYNSLNATTGIASVVVVDRVKDKMKSVLGNTSIDIIKMADIDCIELFEPGYVTFVPWIKSNFLRRNDTENKRTRFPPPGDINNIEHGLTLQDIHLSCVEVYNQVAAQALRWPHLYQSMSAAFYNTITSKSELMQLYFWEEVKSLDYFSNYFSSKGKDTESEVQEVDYSEE